MSFLNCSSIGIVTARKSGCVSLVVRAKKNQRHVRRFPVTEIVAAKALGSTLLASWGLTPLSNRRRYAVHENATESFQVSSTSEESSNGRITSISPLFL